MSQEKEVSSSCPARAGAVGGAIDERVVEQDEGAVAREAEVGFEATGAQVKGEVEGGVRVLGGVAGGAAVGQDQHDGLGLSRGPVGGAGIASGGLGGTAGGWLVVGLVVALGLLTLAQELFQLAQDDVGAGDLAGRLLGLGRLE